MGAEKVAAKAVEVKVKAAKAVVAGVTVAWKWQKERAIYGVRRQEQKMIRCCCYCCCCSPRPMAEGKT